MVCMIWFWSSCRFQLGYFFSVAHDHYPVAAPDDFFQFGENKDHCLAFFGQLQD
jgi:hypothetical protein